MCIKFERKKFDEISKCEKNLKIRDDAKNVKFLKRENLNRNLKKNIWFLAI